MAQHLLAGSRTSVRHLCLALVLHARLSLNQSQRHQLLQNLVVDHRDALQGTSAGASMLYHLLHSCNIYLLLDDIDLPSGGVTI